jgi:hypothetical protein
LGQLVRLVGYLKRELELCRRRVPLIWRKYFEMNDEIEGPKQDASMNQK